MNPVPAPLNPSPLFPAPKISSFADVVVAAGLAATVPVPVPAAVTSKRLRSCPARCISESAGRDPPLPIGRDGHRSGPASVSGLVDRLSEPASRGRPSRLAIRVATAVRHGFTSDVVSPQPTTTIFRLPAFHSECRRHRGQRRLQSRRNPIRLHKAFLRRPNSRCPRCRYSPRSMCLSGCRR